MPIPATYNYTPSGEDRTEVDYAPVRWPRTFVTWTGTNGDIIPLTGDISGRIEPAGIAISKGPAGLGMPTFDLKHDQLPNMDGGLFRSSRATTRDITIPLVIRGIDRTSTIKMHNRLMRALNPNNGPGWLTALEGDGIARHLECYYVSGAEGSDSDDSTSATLVKYPLVLRAMDPYWYSNAERQYDWHLDQGAARPFLSNDSGGYPDFFPLRISAASFSPEGLVEVVNDSSVQAWPTWSCLGSATALRLENVTTGKVFAMRDDYTLPTSKSLSIDTTPGVKTVTFQDGTNLWPRMRADSALWPLRPGKNLIKVTASGVNANTLVRLHYVPRYLSYVGG
ncbi:phage distal tail protein [Streptomyces rimosus]|uniref:phage distal tail protein n=1 Tax=Streptomyces rimosus TaxID=1927 RepID=UPI0004BF3399|nr:phage tail domain-containing protein [Streptomyces rimosus]